MKKNNETYTDKESYMRQMDKFSRLMRKNGFDVYYCRKMGWLTVSDWRFKVCFKGKEYGHWSVARADWQYARVGVSFHLYFRSYEELVLKCMKHNLIPYKIAQEIKFSFPVKSKDADI